MTGSRLASASACDRLLSLVPDHIQSDRVRVRHTEAGAIAGCPQPVIGEAHSPQRIPKRKSPESQKVTYPVCHPRHPYNAEARVAAHSKGFAHKVGMRRLRE